MVSDIEQKLPDMDEVPTSPGRWYPGMPSPNPGGRMKGLAKLRDLAREHTDEALKTVVEIMRDEKATRTTRLAAANMLLDRGYGKPPQLNSLAFGSEVADTPDGFVSNMDLARRIAFVLTTAIGDRDAPRPVNSIDYVPHPSER
jgi:hypothetical protein